MASPKKKTGKSGPSAQALQDFIRTEAARYLGVPNINSVGIGRKQSADPAKQGLLCIQFTVDRKIAPEGLELSLNGRSFITGVWLLPSKIQ